MVEGNVEAIKVEIENIKEDIKEIKQDNKETKEFYQSILSDLKENTVRLTEIQNHQITSQERQFSQVNTEISTLSDKVDKAIGWGLKIVVALLVIVSGLKLAGIDIGTILGL